MSQSDIPWQVMTLACWWDWMVVVNNIRGCHAHDIFSHEELSGLPYLPVLSKGWPDLIIYWYVFWQKWSAHIKPSPVTITDMPFSIFLTYRHGTQLPHLLFYFDRFNFSSSFNATYHHGTQLPHLLFYLDQFNFSSSFDEVIHSLLSLYLMLNPPTNGSAIALGIYQLIHYSQAHAGYHSIHHPSLSSTGSLHHWPLP